MSDQIPAHSFARKLARTALFAAGVLLLASPLSSFAVPAEDAPVEVENAQNSHPGIVNANSTYVRSGPAESYYPTLKLDKGARVTVVGMKLDWLKIVPPEGSFCYISKAFVDRNGDGSSGKVNKDAVNVRAGSTLNSLKVVPLCQLTVGQDVKIVGEQDEYYKIAPPEGKAFVFINKQFVDPDPNAQSVPIAQKNDPAQRNTEPPVVPSKVASRENGTGIGEVAVKEPVVPSTLPSEATGPTTHPAEDVALIEALFDKVEAEFNSSNARPVDQQPIAAMLKTYETIVDSQKLPSTLHKIAEDRVATLRMRGAAAIELATARAAQEEMRKRQVSLQAERKELEDKLKESSVAFYTAVGELQTSSMQSGSKMLYRLTDPANGRTVCYVRTDDTKIVALMGKFIGVKGDLNTEQLGLRVVGATEFAAVDPGKVNKGVSANIVPASMLGAEASTSGQLESRP